MAMQFEELDAATRAHMLAEFEAEEASGHPYRSKNFSAAGLSAYPSLMRAAIENGDEESLAASLRCRLIGIQPSPMCGTGLCGNVK